MMIYGRIAKSKKSKATKTQKAEYDAWLNSINAMSSGINTKYGSFKSIKKTTIPPLTTPAGRETRYIPSLNSGHGVATKAPAKVYTGDKMLGIATLHKSNAVPVFSGEEAVEISSMRR
jgi:hypothetical protein